MKIFILLSLLVILANAGMSQINKGQFLVGGNAGVQSFTTEGDGVYFTSYKTTQYFVSPNIGYFIIPKFVGGLRLDFSLYKQSSAVYMETNTSLSPFIRYYLLSQKKEFNILVDVSYVNSKSKTRIQSNPMTIIEREKGYNISFGPSIFLNEHVALEFLLGYKQTRNQDHRDNKFSTLNSVLGLQVHLGKIKSPAKA